MFVCPSIYIHGWTEEGRGGKDIRCPQNTHNYDYALSGHFPKSFISGERRGNVATKAWVWPRLLRRHNWAGQVNSRLTHWVSCLFPATAAASGGSMMQWIYNCRGHGADCQQLTLIRESVGLGTGRPKFRSFVNHKPHWMTLGQIISQLSLPNKVIVRINEEEGK